jgi:hypothetical protein
MVDPAAKDETVDTPDAGEDEDADKKSGADVVSLDSFRKKN